jgi:predicted glycosyltransferase
MRIVFDIGHPAHVHHFKNVISGLTKKGHRILLLARNKDVTLKLLRAYGLPCVIVGKNYKSPIKKFFNQFIVNLRTLAKCVKFKPELLVGRASPNLAFASFILSVPFISFTDTEHAKINYIVSFPFAKNIVTPSSFTRDLGNKHLRVDSYFELGYLHPKYFAPDPSVLDTLGVRKNEKYSIIRFVSWGASHDKGQSGLPLDTKGEIINAFSRYSKVFVSSEGELPEELRKYEIRIPPEKMHDALAFATLYLGEGGTMATECAMLGTPNVEINSLAKHCGVHRELRDKYELQYYYDDYGEATEKALELLKAQESQAIWQKRRNRLLSEEIDITAYMIWLTENYPESAGIMKENPEHQRSFF